MRYNRISHGIKKTVFWKLAIEENGQQTDKNVFMGRYGFLWDKSHLSETF